jgi:hypothetical protein
MSETHVILPRGLAAFARGETRLSLPSGTLGDVIAEIHRRYPGLVGRLVTESFVSLPFMAIYVDGEQVPSSKSITSVPAGPGSEILIVQAVAGG